MGMVYISEMMIWVLVIVASISIVGLVAREMMLRMFGKPLLIYATAKRLHKAVVMTHTVDGRTELVIPKINEFGMLTFKMGKKKTEEV